MKLFNIYFIFLKFSGEQPSTSCSINEIQCETGECVPALARCNNVQECQDGSDERGCGNTREYFEDIQHLATMIIKKLSVFAPKIHILTFAQIFVNTFNLFWTIDLHII